MSTLGVDVSGNIITGTTNITNATYVVNDNLDASGTTSATTSIVNYGVNVFTGVTLTDKATKLPTANVGGSVKVINKGTQPLDIFPNTLNGTINNLSPNIALEVPADGKLYEFVCIKNSTTDSWSANV